MEFIDLKSQYASIKKEIDTAVKIILSSGVFIGGEEVANFETAIALYCGVKYAIGVNSGTDALFLSLKATGIGAGDEVITTPFSFVATAETITNCGAKPVFVDIDCKTFNIDPLIIEKKITKRTKAIIPVHLFGQAADMSPIIKIAKNYKLKIVEDAAQALGSEYHKKKAGSFGDLGCFSFFPTKNLGAYGDGGMVITNSKKLADKIRLLKNHGSSFKNKYKNLILGTNSRLDAIQAAILGVKLKHFDQWIRRRVIVANYYNKRLRGIGDIITPFVESCRTHIFHQYTIKSKHRDALQNYLKLNGVPTAIYYPLPLHLQPVFRYLGHKKGDFPESERTSAQVLSLPIYPELKRKEQDYIIEKTKKFYEK